MQNGSATNGSACRTSKLACTASAIRSTVRRAQFGVGRVAKLGFELRRPRVEPAVATAREADLIEQRGCALGLAHEGAQHVEAHDVAGALHAPHERDG